MVSDLWWQAESLTSFFVWMKKVQKRKARSLKCKQDHESIKSVSDKPKAFPGNHWAFKK